MASQSNSPKSQVLKLVVGMVIVILGIILFNLTSKWWKEADEREAKEKAERAEMIREITDPDSLPAVSRE